MKRLFTLPLLLFIGIACKSQSISFTYDDSGNRIERSITLKSTASSPKQDNPDNAFKDELGELDITIYPNPVRSELIIDISGEEEGVFATVSLFDQNGRLVLKKDNLTSTSTLNLGNLIPGNYFMIIQSGNKATRWKIVKE